MYWIHVYEVEAELRIESALRSKVMKDIASIKNPVGLFPVCVFLY